MIFSYNFNGEDCNYEPDWEAEKNALLKVLAKHFKAKADLQDYQAELVAEELYRLDIDTEIFCEIFEEEMHEELEDVAREAYENGKAEEQDFEDWFGTIDDVRG